MAKTETPWRFAPWAALVLFSLVAHFFVDAACRSLEVSITRPCATTGQARPATTTPVTTNDLHTSVTLPKLLAVAYPVSLSFALFQNSFFLPTVFFPPPVQPPKAITFA